jgi:histidine triad (HIT) family protein
MDCIFCSIVAKKLPATFLYEDDRFVVFPDIHPKARVHLLVVPKEHIASLAATDSAHEEMLGKLLACVRGVAHSQGLSERGYKVVINTGEEGGQLISHLHVHLLGGEPVRGLV